MTSRHDRGGRTLPSASTEADESRRGLQPARRDLLMGLAGGAIGLGLASQSRAAPAGTLAPGDDGTQDCQPFYGLHQSGVTTPQPAAALIVKQDPKLSARLHDNFAKVDVLLAKYRTEDGGFESYEKLSDHDRTAFKGPVTALAEDLSALKGTLGVE